MLNNIPETATRVLFIIKNPDVIIEGSFLHKRLTDLRYHFDEIHILLLTEKGAGINSSTYRFFDNVWAMY